MLARLTTALALAFAGALAAEPTDDLLRSWTLVGAAATEEATDAPEPAASAADSAESDSEDADSADADSEDADSEDADSEDADSEGGADDAPSADDNDDDDDDDDDDGPEDDDGKTWVTHEVVPGETVAQLALRYRVDPGKIRAWNGLRSSAKLRPHQRLRILARRTPAPRERRHHRVALGETWRSISRAYGVESSALRAANRDRIGRHLRPGVTLDVWIDPVLLAAIEGDAPPPGPAATIRPGAFSVGRPHAGRLVNGVQIPESEAYERRYPGSAWGTSAAVRAAVTAIHSWRATTGYDGRLVLGAMSRQRGRKIGGHLSHQSGRDLDIRLPLRAELRQDLDPMARRVDWRAVWELVRAFEASGEVSRIFLDYGIQKRLYKAAKEAGVPRAELRRMIQFPRGARAGRGLIRHSPGHDIHLHVRFACAPYELECAGR